MARFKQRTRAALTQQRANPGFLAAEMFSRGVYGIASGGAPVADAGGARHAEAGRRWSRFTARTTCPTVRCSRSPATSRCCRRERSSSRSSAAWTKAGVPRRAGARAGAADRTEDLLHRAAQLGADEPDRRHAGASRARSPDYDVLSVMNKMIGGGPTGRLFLHLREEKGYTYGAAARSTPGSTAATGRLDQRPHRSHRAGAARSARGSRADPGSAGHRQGARRRQAVDGGVVRARRWNRPRSC